MTRAIDRDIQRSLYGRSRRLNLETQLVQSVLDYFGVLGFLAFRRNVGSREWTDQWGKRRLVRYNAPGQSDVWAIGTAGLHIEVELKVPGKKPRANQDAWIADVEAAGGIALCVTSLEELATELEHRFRARGLEWPNDWRIQ